MKLVAIACVLGACTYAPPRAPIDHGDVDAPLVEPPPEDAREIASCATPDATGLVLCLELEDDIADGTLDDSSPGRHHATTTGLTTTKRTVPVESPAAIIGTTAVTRVADAPVLDLAAGYTFAVWIRPDALPPIGVPQGILDREQQYAMLLGRRPDGILENRCVHTGVSRYEWTENLPEDQWSFLACTWDGVTFCAYRWSGATSHEHFCHEPGLTPNPAGANGLAIGHLSQNGGAHSRFVGALDSVQIYDRGLTEAQLCALVGRSAPCM